MKEFSPVIVNLLLRARFAVRIHVDVPFGEELTDEVLRCLRRRLAVDLSIDEQVARQTIGSPFLRNRVLMARQAGANIYVTKDSSPARGMMFQADFGQVLLSSGSAKNQTVDSIGSEHPDFDNYKLFLDRAGTLSPDFLADSTDILLDTVVEEGDSGLFLIRWSAPNASSVVCDGLGEIGTTGQKTLSVRNDSILVLRAQNHQQVRYKALALKPNAGLKVNYDIQFFNPVSETFYSLREAGIQDVYGVVKGTRVRLTWNAGKADEVEIFPFGLHAAAGEHIFYPAEAEEVIIRARMRKGLMQPRKGDTEEYRIRIKEFPVPVFHDRVVNPDAERLGNAAIRVNDFRQKALDFIGSAALSGERELTDQWRKRLKADFKRLSDRMNELSFGNFYTSHSVPELNRIALERLRQLYPETLS